MERMSENAAKAAATPRGKVIRAAFPARLLALAGRGDGEACHALGVTCSTGAPASRDLVEAHKWFNLGAMYGHEESGWCRADISGEMDRAEIAEAQRRARAWLGGTMRRAA